MSNSTPDNPFVAHTGSAEAASLLRHNLAAIADQHRGTAMARRVRGVLAGQCDLSELEKDPDFMRLMRRGVQQYQDHLATLSSEEKARLYAEAKELSDRDAAPKGAWGR